MLVLILVNYIEVSDVRYLRVGGIAELDVSPSERADADRAEVHTLLPEVDAHFLLHQMLSFRLSLLLFLSTIATTERLSHYRDDRGHSSVWDITLLFSPQEVADISGGTYTTTAH